MVQDTHTLKLHSELVVEHECDIYPSVLNSTFVSITSFCVRVHYFDLVGVRVDRRTPLLESDTQSCLCENFDDVQTNNCKCLPVLPCGTLRD